MLLYFLSYIPNILLTRLATSGVHPELGRPLTGLETLPASLLVNLVLTYAFIWLSGWHRDAHGVQLGGARVPVPTRYTVLSGIGTALVLFTVPLSFTFTERQHSVHPAADARRHPADRAAGGPHIRPARALVELDGAGHRRASR